MNGLTAEHSIGTLVARSAALYVSGKSSVIVFMYVYVLHASIYSTHTVVYVLVYKIELFRSIQSAAISMGMYVYRSSPGGSGNIKRRRWRVHCQV